MLYPAELRARVSESSRILHFLKTCPRRCTTNRTTENTLRDCKNAETKEAHKAEKTSNDFPLTAHAKNRRCQKLGLKMYDFGMRDDSNAALQEYLSIKDSLQVGIDPRSSR